MKLNYIVTENDVNKTIKDILFSKFHISHRLLTKLKKENSIFLNNSPIYVDKVLSIDDKITISFDYKEDNSNIFSKNIPLDIIYEDDWLLIVNKPSGIPVHPSINHYEDSLSSGIKYYFESIGLNKKIRPVNRIDKDTSGLVVFAKNEYIQESLIKQMSNGNFYKEYIAIVEGSFKNKKGVINKPIARKDKSIIERCISDSGDTAITHYEVLDQFDVNNDLNIKDDKISILKCILETGRTHQIRVHLSSILHPILGDNLYGKNINLINRQALHSYKISFIHPITNNKIDFKSTIPSDINKIINLSIKKNNL